MKCSLKLIVFCCCLLATVSCSLLPSDEGDDAELIPTAAVPTPNVTPLPAVDVQPESGTAAVESASPSRLTVWMIPSISPRTETAGGTALASQLTQFNESYPDFELYVELKASAGQGGILSYLQTGVGIAPSILPDVALIPAEQLPEAVRSGVVFPMEDLLTPELLDDLYPVGRALGTVEEQLYGYPYALTGIHHVVYNTAQLEALPANWVELVDTEAVFVFPANSSTGGRLLLNFYLAEEGGLTDGSNQATLELEPLTRALSSLNAVQQNGQILSQSNGLTTLEDTWLVFQNSTANMTLSNDQQFLQIRARESIEPYAFAPIPGPRGSLTSGVSGWVWVVTTSDPAKRALAAELLAWMLNAQNLGGWTVQANQLPARRTAFEYWSDDAYTRFLRSELERARVYPVVANGTINTALTNAIFSLTTPGGSSPEVLAETAVNAVRP